MTGSGPADAEVRGRAAGDLETSFLVEASAGSGKTTLLVARILTWVRRGRARLTEIVAITFTEKAAADLRLRIREEIETARRAAQGDERAALDQALQDLELAPIRTIHGFCGDLLRARPVEAGIDPGFAVADPLETELLLEETWERWLEGAAADAPPALEEAVALGVDIERLHDLARALIVERDLLPGLPEPVPEDAVRVNRDVRERVMTLHTAVPARARAASDTLVRRLEELVDWVRQTEALPEAEQATAVLTELRLPAPARLGNQTVWGRPALTRARDELRDLALQVDEARARRLHNLAATCAVWLCGFVQAYQERMRRLGRLDFHDLLAVTRDLLRERPDVRRSFQERYRTILVDEFQDTDPLQLEIAFFLAEAPTDAAAMTWDTVRLGPGRLFLVGDPKQSIYRFRRADIETYERARELIARQGEVLSLAANFRSGGRILDAINHTFAEQMVPPEDGRYQPAYSPVVRGPETPEGEPPLLLEWPPDQPPPPGGAARRRREAAAVAALMGTAVRDGTWTVRDRQNGGPRPAGYGDVVCLLRALVGATVYEDAFRAAGIPYRTVGGRHYYTRSEVAWTLAVLSAIEDPYDPVALAATLRSPFFGAPDGALLAHVAAGGTLCYLTPLPGAAHPAVAHAWAVLHELHARRVRESPATVIEALFAATEVLATYALDPYGDQRVANLVRILDTARALEAAGRSTFRALVGWLRAQGGGGYEETESPVAEEGDAVVRLMTVHAAKGLEFPVVILPDLEWERGPVSPRLYASRQPGEAALAVSLGAIGEWAVVTQNLEPLREREARRADAEALRLFYVATTRARDHLVLPLLFTGTPRGFAAFCAPLLDESRGIARRQRVDPGPLPVEPVPVGPEPELIPFDAWIAGRDEAVARGGRTAAVIHPGGGAPRGEGVRLGALVHTALALADLHAPDPGQAAIAAARARLGETGARLAAARRLVGHALAAPPYRRAARARRALREVPVAAVVDDVLVEGVLDLLFEEPAGLVAVEVKLAPMDGAARLQLAAYCAALRACGRHVAEACLLILSPGGAEIVPIAVP